MPIKEFTPEQLSFIVAAAAKIVNEPASTMTAPRAIRIIQDDMRRATGLLSLIGQQVPVTVTPFEYAMGVLDGPIYQSPAEGSMDDNPIFQSIKNIDALLTDTEETLLQRTLKAVEYATERDNTAREFAAEAPHLFFAKGGPEAIKDAAAAIVASAQAALRGITDFVNSDEYRAVKKNVSLFMTFLDRHREELELLADAGKDLQDLAPFLAVELEEAKQDPTFADYTLQDLLRRGFDENGNPTDSPFRQLIERAKQRQADFEAAEETIETVEQAAAELPRIIANPTNLLHFPLDKPNSVIWNLLAAADGNGQLALDIVTSKKGSKQEAVVMYGIDFLALEPDLKITRQLTYFDKLVYMAAAALWNGGNSVISATQIYKMIGNAGNPKAGDLQKINNSLTKMGAARVYIDSTKEVTVNKKYSSFKYDAALLPFERMGAYINGQLVESAIHLFREPPLITFARERGQITVLTRQLLESPISKTEANLQLQDYLLERIGHMKNPKSKAPRKMLYTTIYGRCNITTKKQRQRAPEKIQRYLDHYQSCGWIAGYTMEKDGVTIIL